MKYSIAEDGGRPTTGATAWSAALTRASPRSIHQAGTLVAPSATPTSAKETTKVSVTIASAASVLLFTVHLLPRGRAGDRPSISRWIASRLRLHPRRGDARAVSCCKHGTPLSRRVAVSRSSKTPHERTWRRWRPGRGKRGAPGRIRTCDLKIRSLLLYPAELRARGRRKYVRRSTGREDGAGDGSRTRDPQLGRLMLYQLSYSRPRSAGRDGRIRTADPLLPKQVRYQAAPRPGAGQYTARPRAPSPRAADATPRGTAA